MMMIDTVDLHRSLQDAHTLIVDYGHDHDLALPLNRDRVGTERVWHVSRDVLVVSIPARDANKRVHLRLPLRDIIAWETDLKGEITIRIG